MTRSVFAILFSFCQLVSLGQTTSDSSPKKTRWGFNLGTNYSLVRPSATYDLYRPYEGFGFTMGLLMDHKLKDKLYFSPKIEMSFNQAGMEVNGESLVGESYKIFPVLLEVMPHVMYQPAEGKFSPYLCIGPGFRIPVQQKPNDSNEFGNAYDVSIDVGVGFLNELKKFGIAPELRFSYGTMNVNTNPRFQHVRYNKITLLINFK